MKKTIGTYFSQYFKMPSLFRDDLEVIEKVICDELKPEKYHIACGGFEYDRLDDIPSDMGAAGVLVIYTHSPCLRLKFARSWTELYSGDEGVGIDDAVRRIALIVSKGERLWLWGFCKFSAWLAPLVGFGSLAIVIGLIALEMVPLRSLYLVVWLLIMVSIWWAVGHRYSVHSFSRIDFQRSRGKTPVWRRHRNGIVLFLAGAALGGATLFLLAKFFQR